jgi:hypothetical protein
MTEMGPMGMTPMTKTKTHSVATGINAMPVASSPGKCWTALTFLKGFAVLPLHAQLVPDGARPWTGDTGQVSHQ